MTPLRDISLRRVLGRTAFAAAVLLNIYAVVLVGSVDFEANIWRPGRAVLDGFTPYPANDIAVLIKPSYLYPPLLLGLDVVLVPLGHDVARGLFWVIEVAAVGGALWLVGVRDRRAYAFAGASFPVWVGLGIGNPTLLLLPMLAAGWRFRDTWWAVGLFVGVAGAFKLVVWPLGLWLIATRRFSAAAMAAATAVIGILLPWALIGFASFDEYPALLETFSSRSGAPHAFTVAVLLESLGSPNGLAAAARWALGAAVLVGALLVARAEDGDRRSFSLAVITVLVISPVVERVYFALLLIPIALARPRFDGVARALGLLWITLVLPSGPVHTIEDHGRTLSSAGHVPTIVELVLVLGVLAVLAADVSRGSWRSRTARVLAPART